MKINHLSPLQCIICGTASCYEELPLCPKCISRMQELITEPCKNCNKPAMVCTCGDREGLRFLFFYGNRYSKRLIYNVKHRLDATAMDFLVELAVSASELKAETFDGVAFVPRSKRNRRLAGYDQAEEFAKSISRLYGIPVLYALEHKGNREQKLLSRRERFENMKKTYQIKKEFENDKKYGKILLVDDIVTTGATMKACADILREHTARQVVRLAFAKTNFLKGKGSRV